MRLLKTPAAENDLFSIWEHIAKDSLSAADRFLRRLQNRFEQLQQFPLSGESQSQHRSGLRSIVEGSYIVFYEPRQNEILIYRVLHGARRWEDLLTD
jgi:toxin ParE1/3/4